MDTHERSHSDGPVMTPSVTDRPCASRPIPRGTRTESRARLGRRMLLGGALGALALLTGCGPGHYYYSDGYYAYDGYNCPRDVQPAIVVEFVSQQNGKRVAVGATGTLSDRGYTEPMVAYDPQVAIDGRTDSLAGAFGRPGVYDVRVSTEFNEVHEWDRVVVYGDNCGPLTIILRAPIARYEVYSSRPDAQPLGADAPAAQPSIATPDTVNRTSVSGQ